MRLIEKPQADEFNPYASMYIDLLPDDGRVLDHMVTHLKMMEDLVAPLTDEFRTTPHAEGEWTINEILLHIIDDERIYAYRALRAARNDSTELAGFEQNPYAEYSEANARTLVSLFDEYTAVRQATITLFANLPEAAFTRSVVANNHAVTVRALVYHIAGHELHHLASIREDYLLGS